MQLQTGTVREVPSRSMRFAARMMRQATYTLQWRCVRGPIRDSASIVSIVLTRLQGALVRMGDVHRDGWQKDGFRRSESGTGRRREARRQHLRCRRGEVQGGSR